MDLIDTWWWPKTVFFQHLGDLILSQNVHPKAMSLFSPKSEKYYLYYYYYYYYYYY